jgi:nucleotide-binding universal stress UspA family protein
LPEKRLNVAESIHEIFKRKLVSVGFERTMGFLGATTLGIGALMGAGIYVLIGLAAGSAGPGVWLSYLVCGLLSLLSVSVFGDLSRRVPVSGGGYAFAYSTLGSFWGFITGWLLALGSIFACAMYATGFAYYATTIFSQDIPEPLLKAIALAVIFFLTLPASLALRKLYGSSESSVPTNRWKRHIPEAAFIANLLLLITLDLVSIIFGLHLVALGFVIYLFYSRKREIRSRTGMSVVLTEQPKSKLLAGMRILVPIANPQTQPSLFFLSGALLAGSGGELVVLNVVEATNQIDFHSALADAEDSLNLLDRSSKLPDLDRVKIRPVIRVSRSLAKGIVHAAEEEGCNMIVMGFAGEESPQTANLMDEVISQARTDIVLLKVRGEFHPKRIAVSLGGSSNMNLIVRLAGNLADRFDGQIDFLNILPANYTVEQKTHSTRILAGAIKQHMAKALYKIELASSDTPLDFLVERSSDFDLLIVGATKVGLLERAVIGPFSSQIALRSRCSVAVVRVAQAVERLGKSIIRRE